MKESEYVIASGLGAVRVALSALRLLTANTCISMDEITEMRATLSKWVDVMYAEMNGKINTDEDTELARLRKIEQAAKNVYHAHTNEEDAKAWKELGAALRVGTSSMRKEI